MADYELIQCAWDGEAFRPASPFQLRLARDRFGEGEIVLMSVENERSWKSHAHQFAAIHDLWANLPEGLAQMPYAKSAESLRKHALIECGYADCETIDAGSKAAAERVGAAVSRLASLAHGYAIVSVNGPVVRCYTPHSQSVRSMGGAVFTKSKTAVLEWIEHLLSGVAA